MPAHMQAAPRKKGNHMAIAIAGVALVLVACVVLVIFVFMGGDSQEEVLSKYMEAASRQDFKARFKYAIYDSEKVINEIVRTSGFSGEKEFNEWLYSYCGCRDMWDLYDQYNRNTVAENAAIYGSGYTTQTTVTNVKVYDTQSVADLKREIIGLGYNVGFNMRNILDVDKITDIAIYEVKVTIKGSKDEEVVETEIHMGKMGGKWYVIDDIEYYHYSSLLVPY